MRNRSKQRHAVDVKTIIDQVFGNKEHEKRKRSLSNAVFGVLNSASLIIHQIGLGLAAAQDLIEKHAIKQVDRLLSNGKLNVWESFLYLVLYVIGARKEIVVAIDWTDFDADNQTTLTIHLVTSHGRATPLLWMSVSKRALKRNRNRYEAELLHRLKATLPNGVKVTDLADRGFGYTDFYHVLSQVLGFDFVIRFRGNIKVTNAKGETRNANDWVGKNGRARTLRNVKVTAKGIEVPVVVCVKAKKMKQTWCLVATNPALPARVLIRWYAKRWGIEPQFRDTKDIHFGMGLSETTIGSVERRDRLLLISALSVVILTLLGAAGEKLGRDRAMKANTVTYRTHSLFRQGCYYYSRLAMMKPDKLKQLRHTFSTFFLEKNHCKTSYGSSKNEGIREVIPSFSSCVIQAFSEENKWTLSFASRSMTRFERVC